VLSAAGAGGRLAWKGNDAAGGRIYALRARPRRFTSFEGMAWRRYRRLWARQISSGLDALLR